MVLTMFLLISILLGVLLIKYMAKLSRRRNTRWHASEWNPIMLFAPPPPRWPPAPKLQRRHCITVGSQFYVRVRFTTVMNYVT